MNELNEERYHNKAKCYTCKYHGFFVSINKKEDEATKIAKVCCDYAKYAKCTCLRKEGKSIVDARGDDPENCKLYCKGETPKTSKAIQAIPAYTAYSPINFNN